MLLYCIKAVLTIKPTFIDLELALRPTLTFDLHVWLSLIQDIFLYGTKKMPSTVSQIEQQIFMHLY